LMITCPSGTTAPFPSSRENGSLFLTISLEPDCGLPLGSYLSQWCGTFYLDGLDHFVKRDLKIAGYLRYMDDMVLFGDDREALLMARQRIAEWWQRERRLQLNRKCWDVLPNPRSRGCGPRR
jgi:hypothetical protein